MCASEPSAPAAPTLLLVTLNKVVLEWIPPTSDGGTSILGYRVYMKTASGSYILVYDGIQNSGTRILELTQFNSAAFTVSTYYAYVVAYNWVGASPNGAPVTIVI